MKQQIRSLTASSLLLLGGIFYNQPALAYRSHKRLHRYQFEGYIKVINKRKKWIELYGSGRHKGEKKRFYLARHSKLITNPNQKRHLKKRLVITFLREQTHISISFMFANHKYYIKELMVIE